SRSPSRFVRSMPCISPRWSSCAPTAKRSSLRPTTMVWRPRQRLCASTWLTFEGHSIRRSSNTKNIDRINQSCRSQPAPHNGGMKQHYITFAGYNAWANGRLYAAAAALTDDEYRADQRAFFKSMHGTLNHLLATDRIWMQRFTGTGEAPDRLDAILHDRLGELRAARKTGDRRIVARIAAPGRPRGP